MDTTHLPDEPFLRRFLEGNVLRWEPIVGFDYTPLPTAVEPVQRPLAHYACPSSHCE